MSELPDEQTVARMLEELIEVLHAESMMSGLGGVLWPQPHEDHLGTGTAWQFYAGHDLLCSFRSGMRHMVRDDMYGMVLGVKNILPSEASSQDVMLKLMADDKEMTVHNVNKAVEEVLAHTGGAFEGDYMVVVTCLLADRTVLTAKRCNDGEVEFTRYTEDWKLNPAVAAMRYWMDMP